MAQTGYDQGVATVQPDTGLPNDYQDVKPTGAQGLSDLGEGVFKTSQFFGQVAANDAFNNFQSSAVKLLYGDPTKTTVGPSGEPVPDTGYLGLKGADALNARPQIEQQLDQLEKETRDGLQTPEQQEQFDTFSRRYRASYSQDIGSHADQQSQTWYKSVNDASANNALTGITLNANDPNRVLGYRDDLRNAMLKSASLNGAKPGDPVWQDTLRQADQAAAKTQVLAISADDPAKARRMTENYKGLLGDQYSPLMDSLKERADTADAQSLATGAQVGARSGAATAYAASPVNPSQPVYQQAVTAVPGGFSSPAAIARLVQIESPNGVDNASGHKGYGQFSDATWSAFGAGGDPHNLDDSAMAIQRYAAQNAKYLTSILGRPPTDAELYLAHQQGGLGAARLLQNPNAPAATIIGEKAVTMNGGNLGMTAGEFAAMWTHKFDGTTPMTGTLPQGSRAQIVNASQPVPEPATDGVQPMAAPDATGTVPPPAPTPVGSVANDNDLPSAHAAAIQSVLASDASPEVKQKAVALINQQMQAEAIAADATTTQLNQQDQAAANTYMTQILGGNPPPSIVQAIANDPHLKADTKQSLVNAVQAHAETSASGASAAYGPGFWSAYNQVLAPAGDPSRVSDVSAILRRAEPGGDLTLAGAQKLIATMQANTKPENAGIETTKQAMMNYARSRISSDTTGLPTMPGQPQRRDAEGERLFNARFVPKFESAYEQWTVKEGKNPYDFLTQDNMDKLADGIRSPREKALADLMAQTAGVDPDTLTAPPAPPNVDPEGWKLVFNATPTINGKPLDTGRWQSVIQTLRAKPDDPKNKALFDSHFSQYGLTADEVLSVLAPPQQAQ